MPQRDWDMTTPPRQTHDGAEEARRGNLYAYGLGGLGEGGELLQAAHRARAKPQAMAQPEHSAGLGVEVGAWLGERCARP